MNLKASLDTERQFELLSTQEGGVEVSWYDKPDKPTLNDPDYVEIGENRVSGYVTILSDGTLCVPFTNEDEYWVGVFPFKGGMFVAKTEEYPPSENVEKVWSLPGEIDNESP